MYSVCLFNPRAGETNCSYTVAPTYLKTRGSCRPTRIYGMNIDWSGTSDDKPVANWVTDNLGGGKSKNIWCNQG